MSTRSSLAWAEEFHLYQDLMDDDGAVYLELQGQNLDYSASPHSITLRIPIEIWETIRHHGGASLDLVEASDEDLLKKVEKHVDERIAGYAAANKRSQALVALAGSLVYGGADEPREAQIQHGMTFWSKERDRQRFVADRMKAFKAKMAP
jgi:hypothetical protein